MTTISKVTPKKRTSSPPVQWTSNIRDPKDKEEFLSLLSYNNRVLTRLKEILRDKEKELFNSQGTMSDFDDPAWSHKQAFRNGKLGTYREVLELLSFIED